MTRWAKSLYSVLRLMFAPMLHLRQVPGLANIVLMVIGYFGLGSTVLAFFAPFPGWLQGVSRGGFLIFALVAFVVLLLSAAVRIHGKVEAYETPMIEIVFKPPKEGLSSFHQLWIYQNEEGATVVQAELFRVGVVNRSAKTIEGVRVWLRAFTPQGSQNLPYRLHIMNDNQSPFRDSLDGFRLDPGQMPTQYVDVVLKKYVDDPIVPRAHMLLQHVEQGTARAIPDNRYELFLTATGLNVPETQPKPFVTFVDSQGRLCFQEG